MLRLLIVNNSNKTNENFCQAINLESLGMEIVSTCADTAQAYKLLTATPIDILLTNIETIGMEGLELAEYVHNSYPHIKVIIMSDYADIQALLEKSTHTPTSNSSNRRIVALVQDYVQSHLFEKSLNLKQAAKDLHINYYYLSKCFKEGAGVTFTEYVNSKRLKAAAELLSDTPLHIYEICKQIGMEPKNFHGLFRKYFEMTPQEYRRQKSES